VRWGRRRRRRDNSWNIASTSRRDIAQGALDHLASAVGHGDVVGLHDGIGRGTFDPDSPLARGLRARRLVELATLPAALRRLQARGIHLVTASELVEAATQARP